MKQYIGLTWKIHYYHKFTDIDIIHTNTVKIYNVPTNIKCDVTELDMLDLELIWEKDVNGYVETVYDSSNYMNGGKHDNFRLFVNNEVVHASKYIQKYLIVFDGMYSIKVSDFMDH